MSMLAAVMGFQGLELSQTELDFFRDADPWGYILFKRNVKDREQLLGLTDSLREAVGRDPVIFIDQEGGPVARLRPPEWRAYPAAAVFGRLYDMDPEAGIEACRLNHRLIAHDLREIGINADCAPALDLPQPGAHPIIGERGFSQDPDVITQLGGAAMDGLESGGVIATIKHIPGHGRALADSHLELPRIDAPHDVMTETDFVPFKALCRRAQIAMTAHIVYDSLDPANPATVSDVVIQDVIRGEMGFDGILISDDLEMKALGGSMADRSALALHAGCDVVLHCSGEFDLMQEVAEGAPRLSGHALRRAIRAQQPDPIQDFDAEAGAQRLAELLAPVQQEAVAV